MSATIFTAVLLAAALHAGWNAVVKVGRDRYAAITLIALAGAVISAAAVPFVSVPSASARPWVVTSAVLHVGYNLFLIEAYRAGDLGQVYPIARGAAPLLVALVTVPFLGEVLDPVATAGLVVLSAGLCLMAFGGSVARIGARSIAFALATSGARGPAGVAGVAALAPFWRSGLAGGAMSLTAYWTVIWAMTQAPISLVAALRESSVLFAASLSVVVLREPLTLRRSLAGRVIVAGIVLARVG